MAELNVRIDGSSLERWAEELSARGIKSAIRRALDQTGRLARKQTIPVIAADIGVSKSKIASATPKVQTTTVTNLSVRWTVSKMRLGALNAAGATISKSGGLHMATHRLTGGRSSDLTIGKAFVIRTSAGGTFVAIRRGAARLPVKGIYLEHPATALAQNGAAARKQWEKTVAAELPARLDRELRRQFFNEKLSASTPDIAD